MWTPSFVLFFSTENDETTLRQRSWSYLAPTSISRMSAWICMTYEVLVAYQKKNTLQRLDYIIFIYSI